MLFGEGPNPPVSVRVRGQEVPTTLRWLRSFVSHAQIAANRKLPVWLRWVVGFWLWVKVEVLHQVCHPLCKKGVDEIRQVTLYSSTHPDEWEDEAARLVVQSYSSTAYAFAVLPCRYNESLEDVVGRIGFRKNRDPNGDPVLGCRVEIVGSKVDHLLKHVKIRRLEDFQDRSVAVKSFNQTYGTTAEELPNAALLVMADIARRQLPEEVSHACVQIVLAGPGKDLQEVELTDETIDLSSLNLGKLVERD